MNLMPRTHSVTDQPEPGPTPTSAAFKGVAISPRWPNSTKDRICVLVATCLGLGYVPWIPGTISALWGVGIYVAIIWLAPATLHTWLIGAGLVVFCVLTLALAPWAERYWQRRDPNVFVTDEVAGFLLTVLLFRTPDILLTVLWAFPLTRLLDILKPPPARQAERLPSGFGILADDLCSSLYAAGVLYLLSAFFPSLFGLL